MALQGDREFSAIRANRLSRAACSFRAAPERKAFGCGGASDG
jgi:hypothetical protein